MPVVAQPDHHGPWQDNRRAFRLVPGLCLSDGGLLTLREVMSGDLPSRQQRLAACINDPRSPERVRHELDEIIRVRMLMIAAGYEDRRDDAE